MMKIWLESVNGDLGKGLLIFSVTILKWHVLWNLYIIGGQIPCNAEIRRKILQRKEENSQARNSWSLRMSITLQFFSLEALWQSQMLPLERKGHWEQLGACGPQLGILDLHINHQWSIFGKCFLRFSFPFSFFLKINNWLVLFYRDTSNIIRFFFVTELNYF